MSSTMPNDDEILSDDELAILERAMESGDTSGVEFHSRKGAEYRLRLSLLMSWLRPFERRLNHWTGRQSLKTTRN